MSDQQQGVPGEDEKVRDSTIPPPVVGKRTGHCYVEAVLACLETALTDLKTDQVAVRQVALTFRETPGIQAEDCTTAIQVLQAVRQKIASCLEFLQREPVFWEDRTLAVLRLQNLVGEKTAGLILRLDAFRDMLASEGSDRQKSQIQQAHLRLQTDLMKYVTHLQLLIEERGDRYGLQTRDPSKQGRN